MNKRPPNFDKKILALFLVCLSIISLTFYETVSAISAPSINSTVEPGSLATPCTFNFYIDGSTYMGKNCSTGANDYSSTTFSTVFNSAVTACPVRGCMLFFSGGAYTVTTTLALPKTGAIGTGYTIEGAGREVTKLSWPTATNGFTIGDATGDSDNIRIVGMTLEQSNLDQTGIGINAFRSGSSIFSNLLVRGWGTGIAVINAGRSPDSRDIITDVYFSNSKIGIDLNSATSIYVTDSTWDGIQSAGFIALRATTGSSSTGVSVNGFNVGNCDIAVQTGSNAGRFEHMKIETCNTGFSFSAGVQVSSISGVTFSAVTTPYAAVANPSTIQMQGIISADDTQASGTVTNTDANLKSGTVSSATFAYRITVEAYGYVVFTAASNCGQTVNIKLKDGTTQIGNTLLVRCASAAISDFPFFITATETAPSGTATYNLTIGAVAADANTSVFVNSLYIIGVQ